MHKIHRILRPKMGLIVRKNVLLVSLVLSFLCILPVSALLKSQGSISASPEPQFTDASSHGLSIVPASGNSKAPRASASCNACRVPLSCKTNVTAVASTVCVCTCATTDIPVR